MLQHAQQRGGARAVVRPRPHPQVQVLPGAILGLQRAGAKHERLQGRNQAKCHANSCTERQGGRSRFTRESCRASVYPTRLLTT